MEENKTNQIEGQTNNTVKSILGDNEFINSKVILALVIINFILTFLMISKSSSLTNKVEELKSQITEIESSIVKTSENTNNEQAVKDEVKQEDDTTASSEMQTLQVINETQGYSRTNPAPINVPQTVTVSNLLDEYTATVTIIEILDGKTAWEKIIEANQFNEEPAAGKKYVLVKARATVSGIEDDGAIDIHSSMFECFSCNNSQYKIPGIVEPDPEFSGQVYNDASVEGYIVFEVDQTDTCPKVVFGNDYNGKGGVWFKICN